MIFVTNHLLQYRNNKKTNIITSHRTVNNFDVYQTSKQPAIDPTAHAPKRTVNKQSNDGNTPKKISKTSQKIDSKSINNIFDLKKMRNYIESV